LEVLIGEISELLKKTTRTPTNVHSHGRASTQGFVPGFTVP
jgi:hypothetical protein